MIDPLLGPLAHAMWQLPFDERVGALAYVLARLLHLFTGIGSRFSTMATLFGAVRLTLGDYEREVVAHYEKMKRAENGDVWS